MNSRSVAIGFSIGLLIGALATYALAGPSLSRTTTSISISTVTINFTQDVMNAYATHIQRIEEGNLTSIVAGFESNATVALEGNLIGQLTLGRPGSAVNEYMIFQSWLATPNIANQSYSVNVWGNGKQATVNSTFDMHGNTTQFGPSEKYVMRANLGVSYVRSNSNWLISNELWQFLVWCAGPSNPSCALQ